MKHNMTHNIKTGSWTELESAASLIRNEVFVAEQKVPAELEMDDMDALSLHAIAYDAQGTPIATGRLLPDGHIGRLAVRKHGRGTGIGGAVLQALIAAARERGDRVVALNAQVQALQFYVNHGFVAEGEEFYDAGIVHRHMHMSLD